MYHGDLVGTLECANTKTGPRSKIYRVRIFAYNRTSLTRTRELVSMIVTPFFFLSCHYRFTNLFIIGLGVDLVSKFFIVPTGFMTCAASNFVRIAFLHEWIASFQLLYNHNRWCILCFKFLKSVSLKFCRTLVLLSGR